MDEQAEAIGEEYYGNPMWVESVNNYYHGLPASRVQRVMPFRSFGAHTVSDIQSDIDNLDAGSDGYLVVIWHEGDGVADLDTIASYVDGKANVDAATYSEVFG